MKINSLKLKNFRNIENINIENFQEMNVICGENAQGKTNILEAIWLFTGAKSFRQVKDNLFIKFNEEKAINEINFISCGIENSAKMEIKEKRIAEINGIILKSPTMLAENFKAVVFSPNDLGIVNNGPAERRRFLDIAIGQLYPSYIEILKGYIRAVSQRNKTIKDYKYDNSLSIMLDVFEKEIAEKGKKIISFRKKYIKLLKEFTSKIYNNFSSGKETLEIEYIYSADSDFEKILLEKRKEDMFSGVTSVGPHRDDIDFKINGVSARNFASQGQRRSVALSLKLAEAEVIKKYAEEYPVFLLDDVMSELDPERQNYILNHINGIQSFITCCDPSNIKNLKKGKIINIKNGKVVD